MLRSPHLRLSRTLVEMWPEVTNKDRVATLLLLFPPFPLFFPACCAVPKHLPLVIGEQSEPTECSCQSRFVGGLYMYRPIGRNFEVSSKRRGIVYGMRVHSGQK